MPFLYTPQTTKSSIFASAKRRISVQLLLLALLLSPSLYGQWSQIGATISGADNDFGYDTELSGDGNNLVIGSPYGQSNGEAIIYRKSASNAWEQVGNPIVGDVSSDRLGYSVAINVDGTIVAVSLPGVDNPAIEVGKVRVYTLNDGDWTQRGSDINTSGGFEFGWEIDLDDSGDQIAITSIGDSGGDVVYSWDGAAWAQKGQLFVESGDFSPFSTTLSGDGNYLAFGSPNLFGLVDEPGSVYIYSWNNQTWEQVGNAITAATAYNDFGHTVAISADGQRVAVGTPDFRDEDNDTRGAVQVYDFDGTTWQQAGTTLLGEGEYDEFGTDVKISSDGNTLVASAIKNDNSGGGNAGHLRAFTWTGSDWELQGTAITGSTFNEEFGSSLGLSNDGNSIVASTYTREVRVYSLEVINSVDQLLDYKLSFGPNPTRDIVNFHFENHPQTLHFDVFDASGRKCTLPQLRTGDHQVVLPTAAGIYYMQIQVDGVVLPAIPVTKL